MKGVQGTGQGRGADDVSGQVCWHTDLGKAEPESYGGRQARVASGNRS